MRTPRVAVTIALVLAGAACSNPSEDVVKFGRHKISDVDRAIATVLRVSEEPKTAESLQQACARLESLASSTYLRFAAAGDLAQALLEVTEAGGSCESVLLSEFPQAIPVIRLEMVQLRDRLQHAHEEERRRIRDRVRRAKEEQERRSQ